jgi:MFS family permease
VEKRAADPVLPLALLSRRLIAVTTVASALFGAAMMGVLTFLPVHVQGVLGHPPVVAGLTIAPMLVGWPIASAVTSRILVRTGYRTPVWIGSAMIAVALVALAWLIVGGAGPLALGAAMCVFGMGMGLQVTAIVIGVQSSVGWEQRGVATASNMFARTMGGALGVGAMGAVLALRIGRTLPADVVGALLDPDQRETALRYPGVVDALRDALDPLFWVGGVVAVIGLLVVLMHPRDKRQPSEPVTAVVVAD